MADSVTISETSYIVQVTPSAPDNVTISEDVTNITITEVLGDTVTVTTPSAQQVTIASSASLSLQTLAGLTTDELAEGSNLYYTDVRASAAAPVQDITMPLGYTVTNSLGDFTISVSNATQIRQDIGANNAANLTTGNLAAARVSTIPINSFSDVSITKTADNIVYTDGTSLLSRAASNWSLTEFTNDLTSGDLPAHTHTLANITDAGTAAASNTGDFAAASHTHAASDITSGTLDAARLPAISDSYTMLIEAPAAKTYALDTYVPAGRTVTRVTVQTSAGTCSVLLARNAGTSMAILGASTSQTSTTTIVNASMSASDRLYVTVSSVSSAADLEIAVEYTQ